MNQRAEARFQRSPPPMAFPESLDAPQRFDFEWELNPVPLSTEEKVD